MLWENGEQFKINIDSVLKIFSVKEESFDNEDIKKNDNLNKTGSINNVESDDIKIASRFNNKFINKIGCKDENELEYEKERLKNFCNYFDISFKKILKVFKKIAIISYIWKKS